MSRRHTVTWAEVGYRNAGLRTTSRGLKFAIGWGLACAELGRPPSGVEEYAEVMEESRATAFRDQQAFRKAFPTEDDPTRMNVASGAQARYDELWRTLRDRTKVAAAAQPLVYTLGAAAATG